MSDISELLRSADGGPAGAPDHEAIRRRGRRLVAGRIFGVAASAVALAALAGVAVHTLTDEGPTRAPLVDQPGDEAESETRALEATDRLEVRRVAEGGWPPEADAFAGTGQAVEIDDDETVTEVVDALRDAAPVDRAEIDRELGEPDYEVAFLDSDGDVLARLGYYGQVEQWGEHEGRWIDGEDPLPVMQQLPLEGLRPDDAQDEPSGDGGGWTDHSGMQATQERSGEGTWVVGYFYPDDDALAGPDFADRLEPRWKRISDDVLDLDPEEQLHQALTALAGESPTNMFDAWSGPDLHLELESAELDGTELILDFQTLRAPANGTGHGTAMQAQVEAVALHYYPEADSICVLEDGQPAIWLHDMLGCPTRDLSQ